MKTLYIFLRLLIIAYFTLAACATSEQMERERKTYYDSSTHEYKARVDAEINEYRQAKENSGASTMRTPVGSRFILPSSEFKETSQYFIKCQCNEPSSRFLIPIPLRHKTIQWKLGTQTGVATTDRNGMLHLSSSIGGATVYLTYENKTYAVQVDSSAMILDVESDKCP